MKKFIYIIIPALLLLLGANVSKETSKQNEQVLKDLKKELEVSKKTSDENPREQTEGKTAIREIHLKEVIILQGGDGVPVKTKNFKVILPKNKGVLLYKPSEQSFTQTNETYVEWNWTELSDIYFYKVAINLDKEQNCVFLTLYPIEKGKTQPFVAITPKEQTDKHVSYADFSITVDEEDANVLRFHGQSAGMNTYSFKRPFVRIK